MHNLSAAIVVDQERMGANSRSTLGTATDAYTMLRIIFSRVGVPGGPGAGQDGGRVVFTGPPADLVASSDTLTAQHLREYVSA